MQKASSPPSSASALKPSSPSKSGFTSTPAANASATVNTLLPFRLTATPPENSSSPPAQPPQPFGLINVAPLGPTKLTRPASPASQIYLSESASQRPRAQSFPGKSPASAQTKTALHAQPLSAELSQHLMKKEPRPSSPSTPPKPSSPPALQPPSTRNCLPSTAFTFPVRSSVASAASFQAPMASLLGSPSRLPFSHAMVFTSPSVGSTYPPLWTCLPLASTSV